MRLASERTPKGCSPCRQIQEALGDIGLPELAEAASEAPTLTADDVVAAYVYEAERVPGRVDSAKILAVRNDGTLLLISLAGSYMVERVPLRNIASVRIYGVRRPDGAWTKVMLEVQLLRRESDDSKLTFGPTPIKGNLGEEIYDKERDAAAALMKVAQALSDRL